VLDSKALNVSASRAFYERASSRRHRLKRALSENSASQAEAIPLGFGGGAGSGLTRKKHRTRGSLLSPELPEAAATAATVESTTKSALGVGARKRAIGDVDPHWNAVLLRKKAREEMERHHLPSEFRVADELCRKCCPKPEHVGDEIERPIKVSSDGEIERSKGEAVAVQQACNTTGDRGSCRGCGSHQHAGCRQGSAASGAANKSSNSRTKALCAGAIRCARSPGVELPWQAKWDWGGRWQNNRVRHLNHTHRRSPTSLRSTIDGTPRTEDGGCGPLGKGITIEVL
jgi:HPt (histidine-containing phosphotransfer) domain-containing protein